MGPLSKWGIIGEHARDELIRLAGVNYKAECDMQVKDMSVKELSERNNWGSLHYPFGQISQCTQE